MFDNLYFELPDKPFDSEVKFTMRFGRQIRLHKGFWHKISDQSIDNKPCDSILGLDGLTGLLEIKVGSNKNKVDVYKKLRPNQRFFLNRWQTIGGLSIVLYYSKTHNKYWIMEFSKNMNLLLSE